MMLNERNDIAAGSTDEAMVGLPRGTHHHRWRVVIVERANSFVIYSSLTQVSKGLYNIHDIKSLFYLFNK